MNGEKYVCYYNHAQIKTIIIKSLVNYFFKRLSIADAFEILKYLTTLVRVHSL